MSTDASQGDRRAYRRGVVMGLTVAGVFLLTAFALLFLFTRSRVERDERIGDLAELQSLPPEARAAIIAAASNGELDAVIEAKKRGIDILSLVRSGTAGDAERLHQLIPASARDRLMDALTRLPESDRRKFIDVVAVDDVEGLPMRLSLVAEFRADGRTPAELRKAVEVWEALGPAVTPNDIRDA
jgi:hypothetical protein